MNLPTFKVGDMVTWKQKSSLATGPEPIFLVADVDDLTIHIVVPDEGMFTTSSIFLRIL